MGDDGSRVPGHNPQPGYYTCSCGWRGKHSGEMALWEADEHFRLGNGVDPRPGQAADVAYLRGRYGVERGEHNALPG